MKDSGTSKLVNDYIARGRGNVGHQGIDGQTNTHEDGIGRDGMYVAADYVSRQAKERSMLSCYCIL